MSDSLARQVLRIEQTGGFHAPYRSHRPLSPPEPPERTCPTCSLRVTVGADWNCPACETSLIRSAPISMPCKCGRNRRGFYVGNDLRPLGQCQCEKTAKQLKQDQEAAAAAKLEAKKIKQLINDANEAERCWMNVYRRDCKLPPPGPMHYCYACTRFGGHYQAKRRAYEREQKAAGRPPVEYEEID